ncbi:hypothetical protein [uncultured Clostridium sp.]|uniref:hypothetical protein n=1 Tax=uncultured Clostridium sp. TaxID=59620 RepID=UPI00260ECA2F|nr:hypothetical protein [uncultured Clostridium sp.]
MKYINFLDWKLQFEEDYRLFKNENEFILLNNLNDTILIGKLTDEKFLRITNLFFDVELEIGDKVLTILSKQDKNLIVTNFSDTIIFDNETSEDNQIS